MKNSYVKLYFAEKIALLQQIDISPIELLVKKVILTYENNGVVFTLGNGGGTSVANGFAVDLRTHPFTLEDKSITTDLRRLKVIDLSESTGMITGITNDIGPAYIFSEQLKSWVGDRNSDILVVFSGSGNSKNAIEAIRFAQQNGIFTVCISGRGGGAAAKLVDLPIVVPGNSNFPGQTGKNDNNFHIEDFQVSVSHIVVGLLKNHIEEIR